MQEIQTYTETKDFNPDYNIQVICVLSGSVTVSMITKEGGTVMGVAGSIPAGECRALVPGKSTVRISVNGSTEYTIA